MPTFKNLQDAFDFAMKAQLKQAAYAIKGNSCCYLTSTGKRCMIGHMATTIDVARTWEEDGIHVGYLVTQILSNHNDHQSLKTLQQIHDELANGGIWDKKEFLKGMKLFTKNIGLDWNFENAKT